MICRDCKYAVMHKGIYASRYSVFCEHPEQDYIEEYCKKHKIGKMTGFICYSERYFLCGKLVNRPAIKTVPRWCPLKKGVNHVD